MIIKFYSQSELAFFSIYLGTAEIDRLQEKVERPKGFIHHHIFLIESGEGELVIDGKTNLIKKNDMIYISQNVEHSYYGITDDFKTSYIAFFGEGVDKIKKYYGVGNYGIYRGKSTSELKKHLDEIIECSKNLDTIAPLCSLTLSTVVDFFEAVCKEKLSPIESVYKYIERNYSNPLSLDDLMANYPYSKSKLCHDFKEKYNLTIFELITDMRLKKAHHMINIDPYLHNQKIAEECGFCDVSYFCKMYKRKYGISPKKKGKYIN